MLKSTLASRIVALNVPVFVVAPARRIASLGCSSKEALMAKTGNKFQYMSLNHRQHIFALFIKLAEKEAQCAEVSKHIAKLRSFRCGNRQERRSGTQNRRSGSQNAAKRRAPTALSRAVAGIEAADTIEYQFARRSRNAIGNSPHCQPSSRNLIEKSMPPAPHINDKMHQWL